MPTAHRTPEPSSTTTERYAFAVAVAVTLIVAAVLRFWGIAAHDLWFDENCTFYIVHNLFDWPVDGPDPRGEVAHVPYFFLLHLWTWVATESVLGLRSFSALTGITTVAAIGLLGARMGGRRVGLIAVVLTAVHPLHIHYSQEARSYATWMLAITVCVYILYRAARTLRPRWWLVYVIAAWITFLTHYYTLVWFIGTAAAVLVTSDRRRFWRQWLNSHVVLAILCAPVIWFSVIPLSHGGAKPWFRETWLGYPPALAVLKSIWAMLPSGGYPDNLGGLVLAAQDAVSQWGNALGPLVRWGPVVLVAAMIALILLRREQRDRIDTAVPTMPASGANGKPNRIRLLLFMSILSIANMVVALVHSFLVEPTYVVGRYDLAAWPSLMLALALLIDSAACRIRTGG